MCIYICVRVPSHSVVSDSVTLRTVAHQVTLFMESSRQKYRSGLPFPTPEYLLNPGFEPIPPESPALAGVFFTTMPPGKPVYTYIELTPPKNVLFIIGNWNAKVGSQQTPGVTGKFGLGIRNEAGQRLIEFCQENALVITNTLVINNTREDSIHGHHQMVNTKIRLIIFFVAKDGEALYSQQKQDQELTVAQTMNSLLPNLDLN